MSELVRVDDPARLTDAAPPVRQGGAVPLPMDRPMTILGPNCEVLGTRPATEAELIKAGHDVDMVQAFLLGRSTAEDRVRRLELVVVNLVELLCTFRGEIHTHYGLGPSHQDVLPETNWCASIQGAVGEIR